MSLRTLQRHVRRMTDELRAIEIPQAIEERLQPYVDGLSPAQAEVFHDPSRFRVLVAGRRFGKTHLAAVELLVSAVELAGSRNWYVAPTYRQAKEITWRTLKAMVPFEYALSTNETDLSLRLANGSEIALRGADNPDSLRGVGLDLAVLDEFAWIDEAAWEEVLRPSLADRAGRGLFITTPRGFNWAYTLYLDGLKRENDWAAWQFTTLDGGRVSAEELAGARASVDPRAFAQEFEASFEQLTGRVYSNFSRDLFPLGNVDPSVEDDPKRPLLVGIDFNVNPMSAVLAIRAGQECRVFDALELPVSNTQELAAEIRGRYPGRAIIAFPDPSGNSRKTSAPVGQTDFSILRAAGFTIRAPAAAPAVVDRANAVQAMLVSANSQRRLRVHPRAQPLIRALDGLTYKPGTSQVDKSLGLDHITDALGYLVWREFNLLEDRRAKLIPFHV